MLSDFRKELFPDLRCELLYYFRCEFVLNCGYQLEFDFGCEFLLQFSSELTSQNRSEFVNSLLPEDRCEMFDALGLELRQKLAPDNWSQLLLCLCP